MPTVSEHPDPCPICLEPLHDSDRTSCWIQLTCTHTICSSCTPLFFASECRDACPTCRAPLPLSDAERLQAVESHAKQGHAWAQCLLGALLGRGIGIPCPAPELARCWFELAARQGDPLACFNLGCMWYRGLGGNRSMPIAQCYFERAALTAVRNRLSGHQFSSDNDLNVPHDSIGSVRAMCLLGYMHATGCALSLLNDSASISAADKILAAEINGGSCESTEIVVSQYDLDKAKYWYEQSAALGSAVARYNLGLLYYGEAADYQQLLKHNGENVYIKNIAEIAENLQKEARQLFELSASQGFARAAFELGKMAVNGTGGFAPYSFGMARMWWRRAAANTHNKTQHADAAYLLGVLHYNGEGGAQDFEAAEFWFKRANKIARREDTVVETNRNYAETRFDEDEEKPNSNYQLHEKACFALSILYGSGKLMPKAETAHLSRQILSQKWRARALQSRRRHLYPALQSNHDQIIQRKRAIEAIDAGKRLGRRQQIQPPLSCIDVFAP